VNLTKIPLSDGTIQHRRKPHRKLQNADRRRQGFEVHEVNFGSLLMPLRVLGKLGGVDGKLLCFASVSEIMRLYKE
jgi:hypothetical protein